MKTKNAATWFDPLMLWGRGGLSECVWKFKPRERRLCGPHSCPLLTNTEPQPTVRIWGNSNYNILSPPRFKSTIKNSFLFNWKRKPSPIHSLQSAYNALLLWISSLSLSLFSAKSFRKYALLENPIRGLSQWSSFLYWKRLSFLGFERHGRRRDFWVLLLLGTKAFD